MKNKLLFDNMSIINSLINKSVKSFNNYKSFTRKYTFENRSKDSKVLCMILAGYKEFTWRIVFERIKNFADDEMDICIVSSGLYSDKLSKIAKNNGWSYISTKKNSVGLAQNMVVKLFPNARYIYKLDEDIFITKNFFQTLKNTYVKVQECSEYDVGFVAPIIPVNGYGYIRLLKRLELIDFYEEHFEKIRCSHLNDVMVVSNSDVARFMWGDMGKIPHIDDIDNLLSNDDFSYSACTIRFSIGAIFYTRKLWEDMKYFNVRISGPGMGDDEVQLCSYCISQSKAMIISENTCVGHLSFGLQNKDMEQYFKDNPSRFIIKDNSTNES